jgi:hypothetical protein
MKKTGPAAVFFLLCWVSCKTSKVHPYAGTQEYNDTGSVIRTEEKKMKKPLFDTSSVFPVPTKK